MENRQTSKFQPKIISSLEKPHVSDEPHGKSPNFSILAQNHFEFEKNHMFLMNHLENRLTSEF